MQNLLDNIDLQRLAGVSSILGIDISEECVRVVLIAKRGNPLARYSAKFTPLGSFTLTFHDDATSQQKGELLRDRFASEKITTKYAVASVRTPGVRTLNITIPAGTENIHEWIREHQDKLLKLPIPPSDISFQFEILEKEKAGLLTEITFVRNADIEEAKSVVAAAGLELISLGAGVRDCLLSLQVGMPGVTQKSMTLVHLGKSLTTLIPIVDAKRRALAALPASDGETAESAVSSLKDNGVIDAGDGTAHSIVVAGDDDDLPVSEKYTSLTPFGLKPCYALAAGLALKGFVPELSPCNFLPAADQSQVSEKQYRTLAQRTALVCGSVIVLLLGLQFVVSLFLQQKIETMDDRLASLSGEYAEIGILEKQVAVLESRLSGGSASLQRTNSAKVIHDIAAATPEGVWVTKISIDAKGGAKLRLSGSARSNDLVAQFLRSLERTDICIDPKLVLVGIPNDQMRAPGAARQGAVAFELTAGVKL